MINKQKAEIEDRDRLIVDRNDGTSFADFECEYQYKTKGKTNEVEDTVACVFATNGPYLYKVIYDRNLFAGLIFKSRTRYQLFSDNVPKKVAFNDKFIAVVCSKASTEQAKVLIYRDSNSDGSMFLYAGIDVDQLTNLPASDFDLKLTNDDYLLITINNKQQVIYSYHIRSLKIKVDSVSGLDKFKDNYIKFNQGSDYAENVLPFKYFFVHLSNQKAMSLEAGGSMLGWLALLVFIALTVLYAMRIRKNINKNQDLIRDSGIKYDGKDDKSMVHDESIVGLRQDEDAEIDSESLGSGSAGNVKF